MEFSFEHHSSISLLCIWKYWSIRYGLNANAIIFRFQILISIYVYSKQGHVRQARERGGEWGVGKIFIWNSNGFHEFFFVFRNRSMKRISQPRPKQIHRNLWLGLMRKAVCCLTYFFRSWFIFKQFGCSPEFKNLNFRYLCEEKSVDPVFCCQLKVLPCSVICNVAGLFWAGSSPRPLLLQSAPSKANSDVRWVPDVDPYAHTK